MPDNLLYYGDNLEVLKRHVKDESADLIYLDPPFNSNASYNILFAEKDGSQPAAQIQAFEDTWHWDASAALVYHQVVEAGGQVSRAMQAFRALLGENDMLAYLTMMAPRLMELRRVLKPTGSIYLHCDPTASHYLKLLMDAVFGPAQFRNEIIWKRSHGHNSAKRYGPNHDVLLFYTRTDKYFWNPVFQTYDPTYIEKHYRHTDADGRRYKHENPTGAGIRHGETGLPWRGIDPTKKGRHWVRPPRELESLDVEGGIYWPAKSGGWPYIKLYLDQMKGASIQDTWTDIDPINMVARERLGYPTQKPEALLERIIRASCDTTGTVLDPFCGCGTAIAAAQKRGRRWIGIDITHLAIGLIKHRLRDTYGLAPKSGYEVYGEPRDEASAAQLAGDDPYQFQWWALGLVGARPNEEKKGADKGIDGRLYFHDEAGGGKTKQIIFSVKAGHVSVPHIRDLRGVLDREQAEMGVLLSLEPPTAPMRTETASAGFYQSPGWGQDYPRLQILTVGELLSGKRLDAPPIGQTSVTFRRAPRARNASASTIALPLADSGS